MDKPTKKLLRCAIYTRKSTDHNLDLEFNSLDAQREACEAYIKSQAHEGWRLVPDRYDDGAFSGASLERPALQSLLDEVRGGRIDTIVVYKVDRLTRSLADFAKLVELFDRYGVSFVSVTQSFNTTSSMGRLTLNVLLSFAQFEREVIGERVRDKIAASKRKGLWVGGPVPLGYKSVDKKLVVVPEMADRVRMIFTRYAELGSLGLLAKELDRQGIRSLSGKTKTSTRGIAMPISMAGVANLLRNPFYVGDVVYRDHVARGDHDPIIDRDLFDAAQRILDANAVERMNRLKGTRALLAGRLIDDRGNRMTPSHTNKNGARYRYYVSMAILQKRSHQAGSVSRVPAPEIETAVIDALRKRFVGDRDNGPDVREDEMIDRHVEAITVKQGTLEIVLKSAERHTPSDKNKRRGKAADRNGADNEDGIGSVLKVVWSPPTTGNIKGVAHAPSQAAGIKPEYRDALLLAIAKARRWVNDLAEGRVASLHDIAKAEGKVERHIRLLAPLAFVSPMIVRAIAAGESDRTLTVVGLAKKGDERW
ncbi:MAG: recombinase family protein [Hyphomicrobiaceae bacterium]